MDEAHGARVQVKEMFPQLMDKLSQDKSPDSEALMARAIASFEELNSCLEMAMQVRALPCISQGPTVLLAAWGVSGSWFCRAGRDRVTRGFAQGGGRSGGRRGGGGHRRVVVRGRGRGCRARG